MSILKMKKVTIGGIKSEKDDIMYLLQRMGVMEITDVIDENADEKEERLTNPQLIESRKKIADIDYALSKIKEFVKKKGLAKPEFTLQQVNEAGQDSTRLDAILSKISNAEKEINELKVEVSNNEKVISLLTPFKTLEMPIENLGKSSATTSMVGIVPARSAKLVGDIESNELFFTEQLSEDRENAYIFFVAYNEVFENVLAELRTLGFAQMDLSSYSGYAKDVIGTCEREISNIQAKLEDASKVYETLADDYDFLMLCSDYLNITVQRFESEEKSSETNYTFFVEGWVVASNVDKLRKSVENLSSNCFVADRDPSADETIPTALHNNGLIEPYEAVTDLYSPPDARGFDPNSIMGPFFFMFVGMMVSDAAYGIVLAITCFIALKLMKPEKGMSKLIKVVLMAGISTAIWGALFGSWFAMSPPEGMYWFAPMQDPLTMLVLCYGLGVVHLFAGHLTAIYIGFKQGAAADAIMDNLTWLTLYVGLVLLLVAGAGPMLFGATIPAIVGTIGKWAAIAGAISLVLTQGRAKTNIFSKLISGVLSLYNISGFLSDVLSYSRLFALGLATGVVGMVINTIVKMMMGSYISMPFAILLFVGGHIFNICLNILGAYVHACRLQYIEFYSKFYQDGGEVFKPLSLKTKHVKLT